MFFEKHIGGFFMKEQVVISILERMGPHLSTEQTKLLERTLVIVLDSYKIEKQSKEIAIYDGNDKKIVKKFLLIKHLSGCSKRTLKTYGFHLSKLVENLRRPLQEIKTDDLRSYLALYKERRRISNVTLENIRLCLSSFFGWMWEEGLIEKNPMRKIKRIKTDKIIKKPFTDEELEQLRMNCQRKRDLAMLEFLYSTGIRVSEAVNLNRDQINFVDKQCIVFGKGAKERIVYLNSKACIYLRKYLESRSDDNPALFVGIRRPFRRLSKEGIEAVFREIGKRAGVKGVHPHRFRRTMATNAILRGMPIQEVKELLGHEKLDTTLIYCMILRENVKLSHMKYIA